MRDDSSGPSAELAWAGQPVDDADERLLGSVAKLYSAIDPVPHGLVHRVVAAIAVDSLDAELAELQSQMLEPTGARGAQTSEISSLTFASSSLVLLIMLTRSSPDHVRVDGWVAPGANALVELIQQGVVNRTVADRDGQFAFDEVARGPTQFIVRSAEPGQTGAVRTPNVSL